MQYVTFIGGRGAKRKPDERTYNPGNERNYGSVVKSLTRIHLAGAFTNFSAFRWHSSSLPSRLFSLDSFSLSLPISLLFVFFFFRLFISPPMVEERIYAR